MYMKGLKTGMKMKKGAGMKQMVIATIILVAFVAPVSAATLTVTPDTATSGTFVTIEGTGFNNNEIVILKSTVICYKPVVDEKCECSLMKFNISNENTSFSLSVREVEDNVTIYVKRFIWWTIDHDMLGFHFTYDPATNTSNVTRGMPTPVGIYEIDVIGNAVEGSEPSCTMITTVSLKLTANSTGGFKEVIDTHGIPTGCANGIYIINATGQTSGASAGATLKILLEGDASKDGQVNAYDCVCIARYWAGISGYDDTTVCKDAADIDDDGDVDLDDARHLARYLIGLEASI